MAYRTRISALFCAVAASAMAFSPAQAAGLPGTSEPHGSAFGMDFSPITVLDGDVAETSAEESEYHRRYRRYRRNRIDGGDVLAGVLILGGIAAIASAASNNNRREREERRRYEDRRYDDSRYDDRRYDRRYSNPRRADGSGLDNAVSQCLAEIEQDVRVESVDGASRLASGWIVSGTLFNGTGFSCRIDNNGRISEIDYGGFSGVDYSDGFSDEEAQPAAGQWSEASYAEARASVGMQSPDSAAPAAVPTDTEMNDDAEPQPAYPGGPLPGEEGYPE